MNNKADILLIEDDVHDAEMAIHALTKNKLADNLVHAKDGAEALDFIFAEGIFSGRKVEDVPKVILMDLNMPKVNGFEVLQRLKADVRTKAIPVVVLTSSKEDPDIKICYALGANSYVVKPLEYDEFEKTVSHLGSYWTKLNQPPV